MMRRRALLPIKEIAQDISLCLRLEQRKLGNRSDPQVPLPIRINDRGYGQVTGHPIKEQGSRPGDKGMQRSALGSVYFVRGAVCELVLISQYK
jgi:hypothetical protein